MKEDEVYDRGSSYLGQIPDYFSTNLRTYPTHSRTITKERGFRTFLNPRRESDPNG